MRPSGGDRQLRLRLLRNGRGHDRSAVVQRRVPVLATAAANTHTPLRYHDEEEPTPLKPAYDEKEAEVKQLMAKQQLKVGAGGVVQVPAGTSLTHAQLQQLGIQVSKLTNNYDVHGSNRLTNRLREHPWSPPLRPP